jgi:hypothetical protein
MSGTFHSDIVMCIAITRALLEMGWGEYQQAAALPKSCIPRDQPIKFRTLQSYVQTDMTYPEDGGDTFLLKIS